MRDVLWETSVGALAALLNSKVPVNMADLYTVTLSDGTIIRWSGTDVAVTGNGNTWALGPGIIRGRLRWYIGVKVDVMSLELLDNVGTTIGGTPLLKFIAAGGLNDARVQLDRAFWPAGATSPTGALVWFLGRVSEVTELTRFGARLDVTSELELLNVMVPREVYQPGCLNTVYDSKCGAARASFTFTNTATGGTADKTTFSHTLAQAAGYFDLGTVRFTSGANNGLKRAIKQHSTSIILVTQPWPFQVSNGDTFSVEAGCNLSQTDTNGCPKFWGGNAALHFRGYPYVPAAETIA